MNILSFADIAVGRREEFHITITEAMMENFKSLSGDLNPLHCDKEYAAQYGHNDRVAYGMLCASFYSTLAGMYIPGKYCLLHSIELVFKKPVYVGDALNIYGEVIEKDERFRQIIIKARTVNQNNVTVNRCVIKAGFVNEE
jgi:3-hydroxybutyryl-CoA dehydratase